MKMRRCIQCLVENEIVQKYQRPDKGLRTVMESSGGTAWRGEEKHPLGYKEKVEECETLLTQISSKVKRRTRRRLDAELKTRVRTRSTEDSRGRMERK